nr:MAG: coat protein [Leviviridae sp.]
MPTIANLTIKKNDGTTDIVWTGIQPSSGDGTPATWKSQTVGSASAHQPEFRLSARDASKGASRVIRSTFRYPQIATNTTTGVTSVVSTAFGSTEFSFPKGMSSADINEAVSQLFNLLTTSLLKDCHKQGYAAS